MSIFIPNRKAVSFFFCVFSSLFCGTNYVISAWAPQLSMQCHLSALAINLVGISGNLGVYLMSPLSGRLVDKTGQRLPLVLSSITLFTGYYGLHRAYVQAWEHSAGTLCFFSFLTGVGSSLGNSAALNASARSFPHNRGTATAFPVAAYGLSAFVFSRLAYTFFVGSTGNFLLVLAISCGAAQLLSSFFIGVYNHEAILPSKVRVDRKAVGHQSVGESGMLLPNDERGPISADDLPTEVIAEITGIALFASRDFQYMLITIALLSGSGLMYINNLGNNLTALYRAEHAADNSFSQIELEKLQALNVSLLSILNCCGRIFSGLVSDKLKYAYGIQRSAFLVVSSILFMVASLCVASNKSSAVVVQHTSLLGFTYGILFGIAPVLCSELFGLRNFSSNWGLMSVAPGISGNLFNLLYGRVYDTRSDPINHTCTDGVLCYRDSFFVALAAACAALLSASMLLRRHQAEVRTNIGVGLI